MTYVLFSSFFILKGPLSLANEEYHLYENDEYERSDRSISPELCGPPPHTADKASFCKGKSKTEFFQKILPEKIYEKECSKGECLQILFTSDFHGMVKKEFRQKSWGTLPALKRKADRYEALAKKFKVETFRIDSGDISEGSLFYLGDNGAATWKLGNYLELDVIVIGNHDYLSGTNKLDDVLRETNPQYAILANNMTDFPIYAYQLGDVIKPYKIIKTENDKNICFVGTTLRDYKYAWPIRDISLKDPIKTSTFWTRYLNETEDCQATVMVTHLGLDLDKILAEKAGEHIDLILGGHTHLISEKIIYHNNIPITHPGAHGRYMGKLIFKFTEGKRGIRILHHHLVEIKSHDPEDERLKRYIASVYEDLQSNVFHNLDLNEVIAESEVPLSADIAGGGMHLHEGEAQKETTYGHFVADAFRIQTWSNIGVSPIAFTGIPQRAGKITNRMIINSYPRVSWLKETGWGIYLLDTFGLVIEKFLETIVNKGFGVYISGLKLRVVTLPDKTKKVIIQSINGKPYEMWHAMATYRIAFPEGVFAAAADLGNPEAEEILQASQHSGVYIWDALREHFKETQKLTKDYTKKGKIDRSFINQIGI